MSHSTYMSPSARKRRAGSVSSYQTGPSNAAGAFDGNEIFETPPDRLYGSLKEGSSPHLLAREPTRSFYTSSYRGSPAPIDSAQDARNVREDTAELASYALSDQASIRSSSPPGRTRTGSTSQLDSYFDQSGDSDDGTTPRNIDDLRHDPILEVSEPVTPASGMSHRSSPGTSALTNMLKHSPPERQGQGSSDGEESISDIDSQLNGNGHGKHHQAPAPKQKTNSAPNENTPLIAKYPESSHPDWIRGEDVEAQNLRRRPSWPKLRRVVGEPIKKGISAARMVVNPKSWDRKAIWEKGVKEPASFVPPVILGVLLNVLDALSYGMILFPLGQPIFAGLGPAGISMFYISCIVSQLVYSGGGSIFRGGVGSEMIEVVPFFHKMAFTILARVGEDNPEAVIATTITSYAISSILTGLVFFLMGMCRFGYIVGFIPRHILMGCIGGVGVFLIFTGIEVSARLDGNLDFALSTLRQLFRVDTVFLWTIPFILAATQLWTSPMVNKKYYLPAYIIMIPAVFYFFVLSLDELDPEHLRSTGWIFRGPDADEPWWFFYTLYNFKAVHWGAIAETIPAMFALTFFGVLHVPINVPALGFAIGEDNMDIDRELVAHGISNALSGAVGSIQNYLVYTNSVLFIRTGGTGRLAGIMLAIATFGVLIIGPVIIGYIPVMMVGALIFILGFELFLEAVWEPRHRLKPLEYVTVLVIVIVMGAYDFVIGIFVGIGLAFVSLVVQTSRISAVRASYTGEIAGSTVRRNPIQHQYLKQVGNQIHVTKLAGYLFFGTIVSVEERIRKLIDDEEFNKRPIQYLIFDLWHVTGIDYSAAEAFSRINRLFTAKGVTMVMSGINPDGPVGVSLRSVGVGEEVDENSDGAEVRMFSDLNAALESCENELLKTFYARREVLVSRNARTEYLDVPTQQSTPNVTMDTQFSSPRRGHLMRAATNTLNDDAAPPQRWQNFKEPLRLILMTFMGLTDKNEDFWFRALPYFERAEFPAGSYLYHRGELAGGFYLLESGILHADYDLPQGRLFESIVAGTTCGELPFFSDTDRTASVHAERDCVVWRLNREKWDELQAKEPDVAHELLRISLKLTSERMSSITSYVLTTAG